jgi:O-acetyl-ADP-ribose deacetylase (regulator of RNase III)
MPVPIEIDVWQGEIAELEVDAIIVPANESLFMTNPLARGLKRLAGEAVESEAILQGPIRSGSAVVTGAGNLAASYVIHAVAVGHELKGSPAELASALQAAFDISTHLSLARVAMTPIGIERGVFSAEESAAALVEVLKDRSRRGEALPASLVIAVGNPDEAAAFRSATEALRAAFR